MKRKIKVLDYNREAVLQAIDDLDMTGEESFATLPDTNLRVMYKGLYAKTYDGDLLVWADEVTKLKVFKFGGCIFSCHPALEAELAIFLTEYKDELDAIGSKVSLDLKEKYDSVFMMGGFFIGLNPLIRDDVDAFVTKHGNELIEIGAKASLNYDKETGKISVDII